MQVATNSGYLFNIKDLDGTRISYNSPLPRLILPFQGGSNGIQHATGHWKDGSLSPLNSEISMDNLRIFMDLERLMDTLQRDAPIK